MTEPARTLFDVGGAQRARDEAIERVERNADEPWLTTALRAVRFIALTTREFTTDPVWLVLYRFGIEPPHEERAMGPVMMIARNNGWVQATDRVRKSKRPACHCRPLAVWRSLLYGQQPVGDELNAVRDIYDELLRHD